MRIGFHDSFGCEELDIELDFDVELLEEKLNDEEDEILEKDELLEELDLLEELELEWLKLMLDELLDDELWELELELISLKVYPGRASIMTAAWVIPETELTLTPR